MMATAFISDFKGEDREKPEILLAPNVSPDAQNIDYIDGTIRKRSGFRPIHGLPFWSGGLHIRNEVFSGGARSYVTIAHQAKFDVSELRMEVMLRIMSLTGTVDIISKGTGTSDGWYLAISSSAITFTFYHSGGAETATLTETTPLDQPILLHFGHYDTSGTNYAYIENVTTASGRQDSSGTANAPVNSSAQITIGDARAGGGQDVKFIIDELRMDDVDVIDNPVDAITNYRPLFPAEETAFLAYYKFDSTSGTAVVDETGGTSGAFAGSVNPRWSNALISPEIFTSASKVTAIAPFFSSGACNELLVATEQALQHIDMSTTLGSGADSGLPKTTPVYSYNSSNVFWGFAQYKGSIVAASLESSWVLKWDGTDLEVLAPDPPSGTATAGLSAGALTGTFTYLFRFHNSIDGSVSTDSPTVSASPSSQDVDLSAIPESSDTQVDKVEIYRTKNGGADYYYLDEVANGTTTYNDDTLDASLVTLKNDNIGQASPSKYVVVHNERVWCLNQSGNESRAVYSEVTDDDNPAGWTQFPASNYIDLAQGDGDEITGALSVGGELLVTKTRSVWKIVGLGGGQYAAHQVWDRDGCVNNACLASSPHGVYMLTATGVSILPLPLGNPPVEISREVLKTTFADFGQDAWDTACAIYDHINNRYRVSFYTGDVSDDTRIELVWDEGSQTWAKMDRGFTSYAQCPLLNPSDTAEAPERVLAGYSGYVMELDAGDTFGGDANFDASPTLSGSVTAGGSTIITLDTALKTRPYQCLDGLDIKFTDTSGNSEVGQIRFAENGSNRVFLNDALSTIPDNTYTWEVAPIDAYWQGPKMVMDGRIARDVMPRKLNTVLKQSGSTAVTVTVSVDGTDQTITQSTANRLEEDFLAGNGREVSVKYEGNGGDAPWEVEGFELEYEPTERF